MTFAISILKFFFQKKFFASNCLIRKDILFFSDLPKFFSFGGHQQFFEIFEKVEFLHDHEELGIGNGTVIFR